MNAVILSGNLARDPEKTYTSSGMAVTRFTIAVSRNSSKKTEGGQSADFIRITCFDKQAELVEKYLHKGSKALVEGRIQTGSYEKEGKTVYTTDVIANRVEFMDRKEQDGAGGGFGGQFREASAPGTDYAPPTQQADAGTQLPDGFAELDDDDMPF